MEQIQITPGNAKEIATRLQQLLQNRQFRFRFCRNSIQEKILANTSLADLDSFRLDNPSDPHSLHIHLANDKLVLALSFFYTLKIGTKPHLITITSMVMNHHPTLMYEFEILP